MLDKKLSLITQNCQVHTRIPAEKGKYWSWWGKTQEGAGMIAQFNAVMVLAVTSASDIPAALTLAWASESLVAVAALIFSKTRALETHATVGAPTSCTHAHTSASAAISCMGLCWMIKSWLHSRCDLVKTRVAMYLHNYAVCATSVLWTKQNWLLSTNVHVAGLSMWTCRQLSPHSCLNNT